ncbi:MAG: hypothetical protein AB7G47_05555 [Mycolicibacterium sp.]|uniref:hypothetical protein n=1 Tax=Mycolicibacterium sp. TaxID=2320850 RepID=UPI003D108C54
MTAACVLGTAPIWSDAGLASAQPALPVLPVLPIPPGPLPGVPTPGAPAAPPMPASVLFPLAQQGAPATVGGLPGLPDLTGRTPNEFVLAQAPVPGGPAVVPSLNALNNQYLLPQHLVPSAPGQGEVFGVSPGQENAASGRIDYLKRLYDTYQAGGLEGGLLGQRPLEEIGMPLPVPAPPLP